jgi:hypothetical protein
MAIWLDKRNGKLSLTQYSEDNPRRTGESCRLQRNSISFSIGQLVNCSTVPALLLTHAILFLKYSCSAIVITTYHTMHSQKVPELGRVVVKMVSVLIFWGLDTR